MSKNDTNHSGEHDDTGPSASGMNTIKEVLSSVLAAAIGVQSNKNREKDFASKSIVPYLVVGGVFTVLFIVSLVVVANIAIG